MEIEMYDMEKFIFDARLKEIAANNDIRALSEYKKEFDDSEVIDQAFVLLQNLKINYEALSDEYIDDEYHKLLNKVHRKSRFKYSLWLSGAACVLVLLVTMLRTPEVTVDKRVEMFSMLDSLEDSHNEIRIVSGTTKTLIADNVVIEQTQQGSVVVEGEEKVKSEDIQTEFVQLAVPNGKRTRIKFSDGTVAWVNSGSKLLYPKTFAQEKREIYIEGEIYLEVEKGAPFIVHAKTFEVSVLGTKFNVSAYSEDSRKSIVLVEGSVEVKMDDKKERLQPKQGLFLQSGAFHVEEVDTEMYTCWKDGVMKVSGETLNDMFVRLSRYYGVQINCKDSCIANERYRGKLNLQNSLEEVLHNLSLSTPFVFERRPNNIIDVCIPNDLIN